MSSHVLPGSWDAGPIWAPKRPLWRDLLEVGTQTFMARSRRGEGIPSALQFWNHKGNTHAPGLRDWPPSPGHTCSHGATRCCSAGWWDAFHGTGWRDGWFDCWTCSRRLTDHYLCWHTKRHSRHLETTSPHQVIRFSTGNRSSPLDMATVPMGNGWLVAVATGQQPFVRLRGRRPWSPNRPRGLTFPRWDPKKLTLIGILPGSFTNSASIINKLSKTSPSTMIYGFTQYVVRFHGPKPAKLCTALRYLGHRSAHLQFQRHKASVKQPSRDELTSCQISKARMGVEEVCIILRIGEMSYQHIWCTISRGTSIGCPLMFDKPMNVGHG